MHQCWVLNGSYCASYDADLCNKMGSLIQICVREARLDLAEAVGLAFFICPGFSGFLSFNYLNHMYMGSHCKQYFMQQSSAMLGCDHSCLDLCLDFWIYANKQQNENVLNKHIHHSLETTNTLWVMLWAERQNLAGELFICPVVYSVIFACF